MGTRSSITLEVIKPNGRKQYKSIYCHWDGYPAHNGEILKKHYNTFDKVDELVKLGDLSSLGETIGKQVDFDTFRNSEQEVTQCVAYHRDRGETFNMSVSSRLSNVESIDAEYNYLFRNGKWYVKHVSSKRYKVLTDRIIELDYVPSVTDKLVNEAKALRESRNEHYHIRYYIEEILENKKAKKVAKAK